MRNLLDGGIAIGPRLGFHADAGENRNDLFFKEVVEVGAYPRIGHRLAHRHVRRAFLLAPDFGEKGVTEVEDEKLQPLVTLEILGHHDVAVAAGEQETRPVLDRPQGIRLSDRPERFEGLRDNPVDQGIDPDAVFADPASFRR